MTEAEWLAGAFSMPMFELLRNRQTGSARKRLLIALACCDIVRPDMSEPAQRAVETTRRFFCGEATESERREAREQACEARKVGINTDRSYAVGYLCPSGRDARPRLVMRV